MAAVPRTWFFKNIFLVFLHFFCLTYFQLAPTFSTSILFTSKMESSMYATASIGHIKASVAFSSPKSQIQIRPKDGITLGQWPSPLYPKYTCTRYPHHQSHSFWKQTFTAHTLQFVDKPIWKPTKILCRMLPRESHKCGKSRICEKHLGIKNRLKSSRLHLNQIPSNDIQIMFSTNVIFQQKMFVGGLALQFPHSKNNPQKSKNY